jgi:hypothetical protein
MVNNKTTIIILVYNSFENLKNCILEINEIITNHSEIKNILFVDNKSTDNSLKFIINNKHLINCQNTYIISNKNNYGMGGSQKIAFDYCINNFDQNKVCVLHSSGRTNIFKLYNELVKAISSNDIALMSRYHRDSKLDNYSLIRNLGNKLFNLIVKIFTGKKILDHGSGIFLISTKLLKKTNYNDLSNSSDFNPQMNISVFNITNKIGYSPVVWSEGTVKSHLNIYIYAIKLFISLLTFYLNTKIFNKRSFSFKQKNDHFEYDVFK